MGTGRQVGEEGRQQAGTCARSAVRQRAEAVRAKEALQCSALFRRTSVARLAQAEVCGVSPRVCL